jgi:hypothetical protein
VADLREIKRIFTAENAKGMKLSELFVLLSENKTNMFVIACRLNFPASKVLGFGYSSRQGAKAPSSKGKDKYSYECFSCFSPTFATFAPLRHRSGQLCGE